MYREETGPERLLRILRGFPGAERESASLRSALAFWQRERTVYAFEPKLSEALREQAENRISLGWDLLCLPGPALYVSTGVPEMPDFFAYRDGRGLCFLSARPASFLRIAAVGTSFEESIRRSSVSCREKLPGDAFTNFRGKAAERLTLLLYLSAINAEISPAKPVGETRVLRVGTRTAEWISGLGNFRILDAERKPCVAIRHIRKGHWHTYRLGGWNLPPEEREMVLRWIPPGIVGTEGKLIQVVQLP